jgi:hypothetical protein
MDTTSTPDQVALEFLDWQIKQTEDRLRALNYIGIVSDYAKFFAELLTQLEPVTIDASNDDADFRINWSLPFAQQKMNDFAKEFTELYALRKAKREVLKHISSIERYRSETV